MTIAEKIYEELYRLKKNITNNFDVDYEDIDLVFTDAETAIHHIFTDNTNDYLRIGNTAIHIVPADNQDYKYMTLVYDLKTYSWRNADIYANDQITCINIANIIFGDGALQDKDLNITIDYGTDTSDTDLIY